MARTSIVDVKSLVEDYVGGMGIYDVCEKYHVGKLKVKAILAENGIEMRKKGKQPMDKSNFVVEDYHAKKYEEREGYHYVAIDRKSGYTTKDYMNAGGFLTTYIEKEYGVETPTLYDRRLYYMKTGNYWWEQWFDIVEEKDVEYAMKCPYCDWGTNDAENKSGAFTHHLTSVHHMTVREHLENHPEDTDYFEKQAKIIKKEDYMNEPDNYVVCPLCKKKFQKITYSHLRDVHGIGMKAFKEKYPYFQVTSNDLIQRSIDDLKLGNLVVSKKRFISKYEREIGDFLTELGLEYAANRQILIGREIDMLIPSKRLGIEFDGLKWHSELFGRKKHTYHLEKTEMCNEKGYGLIHIFEDEYVNHKDIVLAKLRHILKKDGNLPRIAGRKIVVNEILRADAMEFIDKFHIQGFANSTIYLGGFYDNKLVAVMTFKHGGISNSEWELTRFATDSNYIYQGVGSKMFTYFVRKYEPKVVISFADRRWTPWADNNLYTKIGFELDSVTRPDYTYYNCSVERYKRFHKMSMSKTILGKKYNLPSNMTEWEMAKSLGYDRIWNCGLFKYVWRR